MESRPTSCCLAAASAATDLQKATDLVREAVSYSGVFGARSHRSIATATALRGGFEYDIGFLRIAPQLKGQSWIAHV